VTVYIVKTAYDCYRPRIEGVFDSKEKAEAYIESLTKPDYSGFHAWVIEHGVQ
jgi:hypothetical protein